MGNPSDSELWESECVIDPAELQIGHFVSKLDRPWLDTPFPLEGVMILSDEQRAWFAEQCEWVVIDLLRGRNAWRPPSARVYRPRAAGSEEMPRAKDPVNMIRRARLDAETVSDAIDCHELLYRQAAVLIDSLKRTGKVDIERARLGLRKIAGSLESNIAAMIWLTRIKHADRHTAEHSVNVAIIGMGLARSLDWDDEHVEHAGLAGLLHDLGKMKLDPALINKAGPLSDDERRRLRRHSELGYELLRDDDRVHPDVARAVLQHHERPDGQGYPDGIGGDEIHPLAHLVAVVNAYDAMTTNLPTNPAISHHDALGVLWRARRSKFDAGTVETLIQFLGWVAPGILVRLSDGDFAVVLQTSQENRLWPVVRRLRCKGAKYVGAERVDLARLGRGDRDESIRIDEVLSDGSVDADLNAILLEEAVRDGGQVL